MWYSVEARNFWLHVRFGELNEGAFVAHLVAIIWRREDGNQLAISFNLVALILHLVRANDEV